MTKQLPYPEVGPWAVEKLDCLTALLEYYTTVLSRQHWCRKVYIDAFAGSAYNTPRPSARGTVARGLLGTMSTVGRSALIKGSSTRALEIRTPFDEYHFIELNRDRASRLEQLKLRRPDLAIHIHQGDANEIIRNIVDQLKAGESDYRAFAFLDPYGPHLKFNTLAALGQTKRIEVLVNFPAEMAVNRLMRTSGDIPADHVAMLDDLFGTPSWRGLLYEDRADLFGASGVMKHGDPIKVMLGLYLERIRFAFQYTASPRVVLNTRGVPLYHLIWAGPHKKGLDGAKHIMGDQMRLTNARRIRP